MPRQLPPVYASLGDYWRAGALLMRDSLARRDVLILHLPRERVGQLKQQAGGEWG